MEETIYIAIPLIAGYGLDRIFGDPPHLPHPVRLFGYLIAKGEEWLNQPPGLENSGKRGRHTRPVRFPFLKGAFLSLFLCVTVFTFFYHGLKILWSFNIPIYLIVSSIFVFYGLAGQQLVLEGQQVFDTLQRSGIEAGRRQLSRIVGRDTSRLSLQQIRIAVLETMSENLGDGVIAPLFYYAIAGVPGMMTYKMINTLDSMIGYHSRQHEHFGKFAARLDDAANFIPARITALLMILVTASRRGMQFIFRFGHHHKSPNAGYPEAALAGILDLRFGGPNVYQGILVEKPYIGENTREVLPEEIRKVGTINHRVCLLMLFLVLAVKILWKQ
jgi:adenosylcobinamide-phosphate synthase